MPITLMTHTVADGARTRVPPLVIAHRGASAGWPENTMPAFAAGIDQGVDMIEIDVHQSKDGGLIVIHDDSVERTTNAVAVYPERSDLTVAALTSAEIAVLDAGSWKHRSFAEVGVPQLRDVLALVHSARTGLLLEVKHPKQYPGIAEALVRSFGEVPDYLDRALAAGLLVVQSADWDFIREFHALAPDIPVGLLGRPSVEELRAFAPWVDQVNPELSETDTEFLDAVHELGMSSLVWTVDEVDDMERVIDLGADGIITNVPDSLVRVVEGL